jgi:NADPH:quinone reductase-like Zn-dependent oxidoreductase
LRAVCVAAHGGAEVLSRVELPEPSPGSGEVLVHVTHVGLNHLDVWVRRGVPGHPFPLPLVPGADIVGRRDDTGEAVALFPAISCMTCEACLRGRSDLCRDYRIRGERCDGGLRERLVVPSWQLLPLGRCSPAEAASLPLALLTAWHMLIGRARVRPGDRVLVQGGAGGVASLAIQVARAAGARVAATASTPEKRALCLALGAEEAWPYDAAVAGVRRWAPGGVDIVVEHPGAATWAMSMKVVRWGGTVVTCGATTGHEVTLDLRALFFKQLSLLGSTMGGWGELADAWRAVQDETIRAVVDRVFPIADLEHAYERIESRAVLGKVVVAIEGPWQR